MAKPAILQLEHVTRQFSNACSCSPGYYPHFTSGGFTGPLLLQAVVRQPCCELLPGLKPLQAGTVTIAGRKGAAINLSVPPEKRSIGMVFQILSLFPT